MSVDGLIDKTAADASALRAALKKVRSATPADATAGFPDAFTTTLSQAATQMDSLGWPTRADDLDHALSQANGPWASGYRRNLGFQVGGNIRECQRRWPRWAAGGAVADQAALTRLVTATNDSDDLLAKILAAVQTLKQYSDLRGIVEEALQHVAVGKYIDFNAIVAPYISDAKQRASLLARLQNDADFIGAVDATKGLVYKISPNRGYRWFTYVSPALFFVLTGAALVGISALHGLIAGWPSSLWQASVTKAGKVHHVTSWHKLLGPYLLVVGGVIIHLIVENLKQSQAGTQIIALNGLLNWIHLRWVGLAWSYVPVVVVVVGLSLLGIGDKGHDLTLWLAAGYSVDSVAGLLLNRFDLGASPLTELKNVILPSQKK